jgi:YceI-like domain
MPVTLCVVASYADRVATFDADAVDCQVSVFVEGLASSFGHDAVLRVTSLSLDVGDDDGIVADFDAGSLRVVGNVSDSDRKEIEKNAVKTLEAQRYQKIEFRSTSVKRDGDRARIEGDLTLHGVTNPITVNAQNDGKQWNAKVTLDQRDYGIKPFSAMLGALKIKPNVEVNISVPNP